jgi:HK97 family phage major capsid protein
MENVQTDPVVWFGGAVKALDDTGRIGGYLVRFSSAADPDLAGDFFTAKTDFGAQKSSPILYHHGLDKSLKARMLGVGEIKTDDVGVWLEGQLSLRDEYEQAIFEMAKQGKLGWSSGTASHLVEREAVGKSWWIKSWPLGLDASLTPTPCEPRTRAVPLKTYLDSLEAETVTTEAPAGAVGSVDSPAGEVSQHTETIQPQTKMENQTQPQAPAPAPTNIITVSVDEYKKLIADAAAPSREVKASFDTTTTGAPVFIASLGDSFQKAYSRWIKTGDMGGIKHLQTGEGFAGAEISIKASNDTDMNIGTAADGGNAVPTGHYQQIVAKRDEFMLAPRLGVRNIPGKGLTVNVPLDNEADGEFIATNEAAGNDRDAPALATTAMTLVKYTKRVELSNELMNDEDSQLMAFLSDFVGRGMAKTHNGLLNTVVAAGGTNLKTLTGDDVIAAGEPQDMVFNNDLANYLDDTNSVGWVMRASTHGMIAKLQGDPFIYQMTPQGSNGNGVPSRGTLLGDPVHYSAAVPAPAASAKSILFGNFNYVGVRNDPEFVVLRDPFSAASTGQLRLHYYFRTVYKVLQAEAVGFATQAAS